VHESIYDEFVEKSIMKANERSVGDPFGEVDQGPQVDARWLTLKKQAGHIQGVVAMSISYAIVSCLLFEVGGAKRTLQIKTQM